MNIVKLQDKLGTAFHESFPLNRDGIRQIIKAIAEQGDDQNQVKLTFDDFRKFTSLGTNQVKSFRRYTYGLGLIDENERLTKFGRILMEHDPNFNLPDTQWAMHYNMSSLHRHGPAFWAEIVTAHLHPNSELKRDALAQLIFDSVSGQVDKQIGWETAQRTATVFLTSYSKTDGLGSLGILRHEGGRYLVGEEPTVPSPNLVAYCLADYWEANWGEQRTANLTDVIKAVGTLLLLGSAEMSDTLRELQARELLQIERRVPPYQVIRRWDNTERVLNEHLYV